MFDPVVERDFERRSARRSFKDKGGTEEEGMDFASKSYSKSAPRDFDLRVGTTLGAIPLQIF
jgi:hypothetical protein